MELIFYITIFIIGTLFGSFYTLAVYRIPKRQDILYTHSYCPSCEHKLGLLDLFPIISYITLGGKCRYCKEKIRPRYLILEVLSGIFFLIISIALGLRLDNLSIMAIIDAVFIVLYITFIILIAGIDKEKRNIDKLVNIYGIAISIMYMIYLWILGKANIYRYVIYLALYILILIIDTATLKKFKLNSYITGIAMMLVTMLTFTGIYVTINTMLATVIAIGIYILIYKLKNKKAKIKKDSKQIIANLSIGFYLATINTIIYISILLFNQYIL